MVIRKGQRSEFRQRLSSLGLVFAASAVALGGCGGGGEGGGGGGEVTPAGEPAPPPGDQTFSSAEPFVAVYAPPSAERTAQLTGGAGAPSARSFYLAVRKSELQKPWFLSAYLKQFYPGAVAGGAGQTLGTRVVSFEVQNDKLFVFDVDRRKTTSDAFDPQVLVEAYPVLNAGFWSAFPGSSDYVVFDPAGGLNRFDVVGEAYGAGGVAFATELTYSQNYRKIDDGITFEQVFTGYANVGAPLPPEAIETNQLRASGTIGIGLRRYRESEGFEVKPLPSREYYFRSEPRLVPNEGLVDQSPARWSLGPDKKPVRWIIQSTAADYAQQAPANKYDFVGALKRGVETWNAAFGFEALTAELGTPGDSFADDDKNVIIFDADPSYGSAFANWRTNPNTGEIRGASVYFNAIWLTIAEQIFADDAAPTGLLPAPGQAAARPASVSWGPLRDEPLCVLPLGGGAAEAGSAPLARALSATNLTKKEKVERYIQHVVAHEIGHTLGLRHNFKGSLAPPSSSVMEYVLDEDAIFVADPGSYDVDAVRFLYDLSPDEPTQAFCTDQDTLVDPTCARYDAGARPLSDYAVPNYRAFLDAFLFGASPNPPNNSLNRVLAYVRAGETSDVKLEAWEGAFAPLRTPAAGAPPAAVDAATASVFRRLLLSAPEERGELPADVQLDALLTAQLAADLKGTVLNANGALSFATRRLAVDALEKLQRDEAYVALVAARDALEAQLPSLTGDAAALTSELIARAERALDPYFD